MNKDKLAYIFIMLAVVISACNFTISILEKDSLFFVFATFITISIAAYFVLFETRNKIKQIISIFDNSTNNKNSTKTSYTLEKINDLFQEIIDKNSFLEQNLFNLELQIKQTIISHKNSLKEAEEATKLSEDSRAKNLLNAATKLEEVVKDILTAAGQISNQMEQISIGAENQTQRMNETVTAMDEMNIAIRDISHSSSDASLSIESTKDNADGSEKIAIKTIESISKVNTATNTLKIDMQDLANQAQSIDQILNVISDIADQTNLLALNAAIEAARAGDAGRGFAVVADEVRKLAEKTMHATKQVSETIISIQNSVQINIQQMEKAVHCAEEASQMATKSGESAQEIKRYAEENASKIHSIAAASEEQSATSSHINKAISEVGKIAFQISDGINESTQAVLVLSELSKELSVLISDLKSGMESGILMPWTSQLATGVKFVDEQHRKLVDMINCLYKAMKSGQGKDSIEKLLDDLANYTVYHFDAEEKIFHKTHYPETSGHIKIHEDLKSKVISFINKYKSGSENISMDLMNFLKDWLENHICKTDKRYVKTFLDAGIEPTSK